MIRRKKEYRVVEITVHDFSDAIRDVFESYYCVQVKTRRGWVQYDDSKTQYTGTSRNKFRNLPDAIRFKDFLERKIPKKLVKVWDEKSKKLVSEKVFNEILRD